MTDLQQTLCILHHMNAQLEKDKDIGNPNIPEIWDCGEKKLHRLAGQYYEFGYKNSEGRTILGIDFVPHVCENRECITKKGESK